MKRKPRILISGGGTGGHIFPALSIAEACRRRFDADILFVGAEGRMEMQRVPQAGYEIKALPVAGFDRRNLFKNFKVLVKLFKSLNGAKKILRDFRPDIAVGVGGYASGPVLKAAQKAGIPTLLQEQNSYAGVTNKLLARKSDCICTAYPDMGRFFPADKIRTTGNPVRSAVVTCPLSREEAKTKLGFDPSKPLLLVVGGSLGALTLNESMARYAEKFEKEGVQVLWQTGKNYYPKAEETVAGLKSVKAMPFISEMGEAYAAADAVVGRAGACTISELQLLGKPCVLVPSPNVAEDHQTKNARALADRGAAVLLPDAECRDLLFDKATELINSPEKLSAMTEALKAMSLPESDEKIADEIERLLARAAD